MGGEFLNIARILERTGAEGPGYRFCIWTQGCLRDCPGCCNASMQPIEPKMLVSARDIASCILDVARSEGLDGVTFLGGEPMLQAKGLSTVASIVRQEGLNVMVFTGFTLEECLADQLPGVKELLAETDVLVDGPYLADKPERVRNWIGSSNQRFHYFSDAYGPEIETEPGNRGQIEFRVEGDTLRINGCPRVLPGGFRMRDTG